MDNKEFKIPEYAIYKSEKRKVFVLKKVKMEKSGKAIIIFTDLSVYAENRIVTALTEEQFLEEFKLIENNAN